MPSLEANKELWTNQKQWLDKGNKWSTVWGTAEAQWNFTLYPRIQHFLPTGTILEIAPGYGRWTQFLRKKAGNLIIVDLVEDCIEACKERFSADDNIQYFTNDGKSLEFIKDGSIDFVFSFDSLVHAESDVLESYLEQLSKKLKPNGVGFIHHSNIGEYTKLFKLSNNIKNPQQLRSLLKNIGAIEPDHWRAHSMTAKKFEEFCKKFGLQCISQELVNWQGGLRLIDSFSIFTKTDSVWSRENRILENNCLMTEAKQISRLSNVYNFQENNIKDNKNSA